MEELSNGWIVGCDAHSVPNWQKTHSCCHWGGHSCNHVVPESTGKQMAASIRLDGFSQTRMLVTAGVTTATNTINWDAPIKMTNRLKEFTSVTRNVACSPIGLVLWRRLYSLPLGTIAQ